MKKLTTVLSSLAIAAIMGYSFGGCTSETTGPGTTTLVAPSNLMALSKNSTTISLKWTRDASDAGGDTVYVSANSGTAAALPPVTGNSVDVANLTAGTSYTFFVRNAAGASSVVTWMTASRATGVKIYQISSTAGPSGIDLKNGVAVSAVAANQNVLDFILDDVESNSNIVEKSGLALESPTIIEPWRSSFVSTSKRYVVGGLDADYSTSDFSSDQQDMLTNQKNVFQLPDSVDYRVTGHRIILVTTADGNLAKIDIIPDPSTGKLYSGTSPNKYITVNVSYQTTAGKPYAARGISRFGHKTPFNSTN